MYLLNLKNFLDQKYFSKFYFKDCPKECDYTVFKTSVNSADYPTDYYATMLLAQPKILGRFNNEITFVPYDKPADSKKRKRKSTTVKTFKIIFFVNSSLIKF